MRWAITGTPGVGKSTAAARLSLDRPVIHLHDVMEDSRFCAGLDEGRGTTVADLDALRRWTRDQPDDALIESHLAHRLPVDRVVVLRCHPDELRTRLQERPDASPSSIEENVECETLDLILSEAIEQHGRDDVFEIDTTQRSPAEVSDIIGRAIAGALDPRAGIVSYLEDA